MLEGLRDYLVGGMRASVGVDPFRTVEATVSQFDSVTDASRRHYQFGPRIISFDPAQPLKAPSIVGKLPGAGMGSYAFPGLAIGGTLVGAYLGYQEDGLSGARDMMLFDLAINSAFMSGYSKTAAGYMDPKIGKATISGRLAGRTGKLGMLGRGVGLTKNLAGSVLGAMAGEALGGTPGAFAGAFLGAKLGRGTSSVLLAAGTGVGLAGAEVVKQGSAVLKAGYMNQRMRRRIDTAGSMASFMTKNAFTERSRAVQAMHRSHLNARSALGGEAGYMHNSRDYFSRYKRF